MPLSKEELTQALHKAETKHNTLLDYVTSFEERIEKERSAEKRIFNIFALLSAFACGLILFSDDIVPFFISTKYNPTFGLVQGVCVGLSVVGFFIFLILGKRK